MRWRVAHLLLAGPVQAFMLGFQTAETPGINLIGYPYTDADSEYDDPSDCHPGPSPDEEVVAVGVINSVPQWRPENTELKMQGIALWQSQDCEGRPDLIISWRKGMTGMQIADLGLVNAEMAVRSWEGLQRGNSYLRIAQIPDGYIYDLEHNEWLDIQDGRFVVVSGEDGASLEEAGNELSLWAMRIRNNYIQGSQPEVTEQMGGYNQAVVADNQQFYDLDLAADEETGQVPSSPRAVIREADQIFAGGDNQIRPPLDMMSNFDESFQGTNPRAGSQNFNTDNMMQNPFSGFDTGQNRLPNIRVYQPSMHRPGIHYHTNNGLQDPWAPELDNPRDELLGSIGSQLGRLRPMGLASNLGGYTRDLARMLNTPQDENERIDNIRTGFDTFLRDTGNNRGGQEEMRQGGAPVNPNANGFYNIFMDMFNRNKATNEPPTLADYSQGLPEAVQAPAGNRIFPDLSSLFYNSQAQNMPAMGTSNMNQPGGSNIEEEEPVPAYIYDGDVESGYSNLETPESNLR